MYVYHLSTAILNDEHKNFVLPEDFSTKNTYDFIQKNKKELFAAKLLIVYTMEEFCDAFNSEDITGFIAFKEGKQW